MIGNISVGKRISKEEMLKTQEKEKPKVPVCISWLFLESILSFCFFVLFYVHFRHSPRDMFLLFFWLEIMVSPYQLVFTGPSKDMVR